MRIFFDESTIEQGDNASRSITGVVFFDFGQKQFPEDEWIDFVAVIARWWVEAVEKLRLGLDKQVTFRFMDGPFSVTATMQAGGMVKLRCAEDGPGVTPLCETEIELQTIIEQVHGLARRAVSAFKSRGFESRDVDMLRKCLPS